MYCMKRYPVAVARERLAEALNEADRGVPVIIERRGVRYRLTREPRQTRKPSRASVVEHIDRDVAAGEWSWEWARGGLQFASRAKANKRRS
jgi:hypothetical protein